MRKEIVKTPRIMSKDRNNGGYIVNLSQNVLINLGIMGKNPNRGQIPNHFNIKILIKKHQVT